jgi:hypothetical protein
LVSPGPYDVRRPSGTQPTRHPSAEASGGPPWTSALLQSASPGTRAVPPGEPGSPDDASSPGLPSPYDTAPGRGVRVVAADPSAAAGPRAGFGYPLRGSYLRPCRRRSAGASMGFTLQGVPLVAIGTPLGAHALLPLPVDPTPPRRGRLPTWPASRPRSCNESVLSPGSRMIPTVDTFLGFDPPERAPTRPGARFDSRRLPSRPWAA